MSLGLKKALCLTLFLISVVASLQYGSTDTGFHALWRHIISGGEDSNLALDIFIDLRVTRVLSCILSGMALSCAGVLSQGLFRNALASPSVIGTTAGGAAFATLALVLGMTSTWLLPVSAFLGCVLATTFILLIGYRVGTWGIETLLLTGLAVSAFFSAMTSLNLSIALDEFQRLPVLMHWLMGSVTSHPWTYIIANAFCVVLAIIWAYSIARKLDVLAMGEDVASSLGLNIRTFTFASIVCIALLEALSMSLSGALTFIGLMIPHITRTMLGPQHKTLLIFSALNGASLLCLSDLLSRKFTSPVEFQVGIVIACLGSAFFVHLLLTYQFKARD